MAKNLKESMHMVSEAAGVRGREKSQVPVRA